MIANQFVHFMGSSSSSRSEQRNDRLISLIVLVIMLSIGPIGYHIIVLNVPSSVIQRAIGNEFRHKYGIELIGTSTMDVIWSFVVSCQSIGALIGCFLVVPMEKHLGTFTFNCCCFSSPPVKSHFPFGTKRSLLLLNNLILVVASLLFMLISEHTNVLLLLIIGRLLVGLYTGIGCALVPVYVQELAPSKLRGALCCFVHIAICAGSALAAFLSLGIFLGGPATWTTLLSLPMLFALAQIFLGHFLLETPNFFLRRGNQVAAANSIRFHYSMSHRLDSETVIRQYQSLVDRLPAQISFRQSLEEPKIRGRLLLGMAISVAQIFSGSMAAVSYSTTMLQSVALTSWLTPFIPTLGSLLSIAMTLPALHFVDSCGRKQLLVNTLGICAMANCLLVLFSLLAQLFAGPGNREQSWASIGFLLCFFVYGIGYNVGVGPVAYFLPAELVPAEAISASMGASTALNWLSSMLTTIVYYPLNEAIGGWSFLFFALPTLFFAVFFHQKLPDPIGEEVAADFDDSDNARRSPSAISCIKKDEEAFVDCAPIESTSTSSARQLPSLQSTSAAAAVEHTPLQQQTSFTSDGTWYSTFSNNSSGNPT